MSYEKVVGSSTNVIPGRFAAKTTGYERAICLSIYFEFIGCEQISARSRKVRSFMHHSFDFRCKRVYPAMAASPSRRPMKASPATTLLFFATVTFAYPQDFQSNPPQRIPLTVPPGVPLRLYLTKRVSKRMNAAVEAKLAAPVYAFDCEVIPSGTQAVGHVSRLESVSKWRRVRAILSGDFTPLHVAQIDFTSLLLPDGREIQLHTVPSAGLNSVLPLRPPKQRSTNAQSSGGLVGTTKQKLQDQAAAQVDRIKSIPDLVRGTDKKEWLSDYLMSRLPYHPQYVRSRTRFDAELSAPLNFGSEAVTPGSMALLGSQPAAGSVVHARLLTPVDSGSSTPGQKVEAVLEQPLFSADHKLILPEGTQVDGSVVLAKKAGWFHHAGRLRFNFQNIELPDVAQLRVPGPTPTPLRAEVHEEKRLQVRTQGTLSAAESDNAQVKVDAEGGVQATESKTRFIGTAVALLVARAAGDNDPIRAPSTGGSRGAIIGQSQNVAGRTLGGGLGFGLLGTIAAQSSRTVGAAFGYYGLAWSVFSTVVARGPEVQFDKNAVVDIGFNTRASKPGNDSTTAKH
jgi:hypothetical protein